MDSSPYHISSATEKTFAEIDKAQWTNDLQEVFSMLLQLKTIQEKQFETSAEAEDPDRIVLQCDLQNLLHKSMGILGVMQARLQIDFGDSD